MMSRRVKPPFHQFLYGERVVNFMVASRWNDDRKRPESKNSWISVLPSSVGKLRSSEISSDFSIVKLVKIVRWNLSLLHSGGFGWDSYMPLYKGEIYLFIICNSRVSRKNSAFPDLRDRPRIIRPRNFALTTFSTDRPTNSLMIFRDFFRST